MTGKSIIAALIALAAVASAIATEATTQSRPIGVSAAQSSLQWGPCPEIFPPGCQIAVLHGDPAKANADIFFKVPAGYKIPNHRHTSPERMVLVSGKMTVKYKGHDSMTLKEGAYAYGPANVPHSATCLEGNECILFVAFEDAVDAHLVKQ